MGFSSGPIQTNGLGECSRNGTLGRGEGHISARGPQAWMLQEGLLRRGRSDSSNRPSKAVASKSMASSIGTAFGMSLLCSTMVDAPLYVAGRGIIPRLLRFMHGGSQAFQGLVLGGTNGLFGHLKHLGHHIDGLFVLI